MKYLTRVIAFFFIASAFACSQPSEKDVESQDAEVLHEEHDEHAHSNEESELKLNDGQKWEANPETNEGIANMKLAVENYQEEGSKDLDSLQMQLFSEFRTLVSKCTMEGEAHDQLHHYIIPLKKKMDALNSPDGDVAELYAYLETYSDYFE